MSNSRVVIGSSFYLNVGRSDPGVRRNYLQQTKLWAQAVRRAGYPFFLEIKHLGLIDAERMAELRDITDTFTLHLQYLSRPGKAYNTLNMVDPADRGAIKGDVQIANAFSQLRPKLVSVHCGFSAVEIGTAPPDDHNFAVTRVLSRSETATGIKDTLNIAAGCFAGMEYRSPILIENLDYRPGDPGLGMGGAYEHVCEPDFIFEVLRGNPNVCSLLDVAHGIIAAANLHVKYKINDLAAKLYESGALYQLHLNAPKRDDGGMLDMHLPFYKDTEVVQTLLTVMRLHKANVSRETPLFITIEPKVSDCETDPFNTVYLQGMELLKLLRSSY